MRCRSTVGYFWCCIVCAYMNMLDISHSLFTCMHTHRKRNEHTPACLWCPECTLIHLDSEQLCWLVTVTLNQCMKIEKLVHFQKRINIEHIHLHTKDFPTYSRPPLLLFCCGVGASTTTVLG